MSLTSCIFSTITPFIFPLQNPPGLQFNSFFLEINRKGRRQIGRAQLACLLAETVRQKQDQPRPFGNSFVRPLVICQVAGQSEEDLDKKTDTELMKDVPNKARQEFSTILMNREIVGSAGTMILTFSFKNESNFAFGAGDHIGIIPPPQTEHGERPRERWYSLASLPYQGTNGRTSFDLVVSQLRYTTRGGQERRGLCTSYLHDIPEGSGVSCCYRYEILPLTHNDSYLPLGYFEFILLLFFY